jgi:hypothetical protein
MLCAMLSQSLAEEGLVLAHFDRITGALDVKLSKILEGRPELWNVVREDLCFATPDLRVGFRLEVKYFDWYRRSVSQGLFHLSVWGVAHDKKWEWYSAWSGIRHLGRREPGTLEEYGQKLAGH